MSNSLNAADKLDVALTLMTIKQLEAFYVEVEIKEGKREVSKKGVTSMLPTQIDMEHRAMELLHRDVKLEVCALCQCVVEVKRDVPREDIQCTECGQSFAEMDECVEKS